MAFIQVVLPIFLIIAAGYVLQRWRQLDLRVLTTLLMYVLSPALTFSAIVKSPLSGQDIGVMVYFAVILLGLSWLLGSTGGRLLHLSRETTTGVIVSCTLMNTGNYGGFAALFAWGEEGFQKAIVFMAIHFVMASILAIYISARGQKTVGNSLAALLGQPLFYAALLAGMIRLCGWEGADLPAFLMEPIDHLGRAAIPVALLLLGMQLTEIRLETADYSALALTSLLRLVLIPLLLIPVLTLLGATGTLRSVLLLQAATPTAINAVVYTSEFDARPDLVSASVVTTTLLSLVTLTILLHLLGVS